MSGFNNKVLDGNKGKLMLQIAKTFKGDSRFKLDATFEKDVDPEDLPQKFKQTLQKDLLQRVQEKTKFIKKEQPPLIIRRFEPGTHKAQKIVAKAQNKKKTLQNIMKSQKKKMKKQKLQKGIDKIRKADQLLQPKKQQPRHDFKLEVKGNRQQAFKPSHFKLFQ